MGGRQGDQPGGYSGMRPRAIFFDMDDTLLDGVSAMQAAWAVVCAEYAPLLGCPPDALRDAIRREASAFWKDEELVGHWRVRLQDARTHVIGLALTAEGWDPSYAERISIAYGAEHRARLCLFDDAVETLEALRGAGLLTGLITNGPSPLQRDKIERFDLARHMDAIVIEGEFGKGKPERAIFEHALKVVRAGPDEAWMVGDNLEWEVAAPQRLGIFGVWHDWQGTGLPEGCAVRPDRIIRSLTELVS